LRRHELQLLAGKLRLGFPHNLHLPSGLLTGPAAVILDDRPAADRAGLGQGHRDGLWDLVGRGRGPMAMPAVGVAALAARSFEVGLGFALELVKVSGLIVL
jgi:hypothetical protein